MLHELRWGQGRQAFQLPTCFVCCQQVSLAQWAAKEECPGRPKCEPPAIHIFLDGNPACECGEIDYSMLAKVVA